jgi:hypothetical protein
MHVRVSPLNGFLSDSDELFYQSCKATTELCKKDLENDELAKALQFKSLSNLSIYFYN